MRILLAEDSALLREGLVALLERAGHEIVAAVPTATELEAEAEALLPSGDVDLLLTDVRMPPGHGDDGLRVATAVRGRHPGFPVIVLSQYVEHRYAAALLGIGEGTVREGGVGYLLKDRVAHVHDFVRTLEVVRSGGIVIDPAVVSALLENRRDELSSMSAREREVLGLVSAGWTNDQVAGQLHLSRGAVVKHVSAVFDKLGLAEQEGNRRVLAVLAFLRDQGQQR